jgi:hypothetical protein
MNQTSGPVRSNSRPDEATLIVFLENSGRIEGLSLPAWASQLVDWFSEEYVKLIIRLQARRHYREIIFLEDHRATAGHLWQALLAARDRPVDLLMLVHGQQGYACGFGQHQVGADFFQAMRQLQAAGLAHFRLRVVYQMNCYGTSLAQNWLSLGAQAVNGSVGVNWLPEPSLSLFLRSWLGGKSFGEAVNASYHTASRLLGQIWRPPRQDCPEAAAHPKIQSSRMVVFGNGDLTRASDSVNQLT